MPPRATMEALPLGPQSLFPKPPHDDNKYGNREHLEDDDISVLQSYHLVEMTNHTSVNKSFGFCVMLWWLTRP